MPCIIVIQRESILFDQGNILNATIRLQSDVKGGCGMLNDNLKNLRLKHGMTQKELAGILHVCRTTITGWEAGKRIPDIFTLCNIADVFHVSLDELVGRKKE